MEKILFSLKSHFHNQCSNLFLTWSNLASCEKKQRSLYEKAYTHNEKFLKNKIKAQTA